MCTDVWRPLPEWLGGEQPYDLNSWQESETALALADTLDEDAVIVEGYAEYATWRPHLAYLRDPYGDPDMEMEIDGVGGVSILAKAQVFRYGVHFPAFSFEKHAETEGFGKVGMKTLACYFGTCLTQCRWRRGCSFPSSACPITRFGICTNPAWTTLSTWRYVTDLCCQCGRWANISQQMELARLAQEKEDKEKAEKAQKLKESFGDTTGQWEEDKTKLQNLALQEKKKEVANAAVAAKEKKAGAQAAAGKTEEKLVARDGQQDGGKT